MKRQRRPSQLPFLSVQEFPGKLGKLWKELQWKPGGETAPLGLGPPSQQACLERWLLCSVAHFMSLQSHSFTEPWAYSVPVCLVLAVRFGGSGARCHSHVWEAVMLAPFGLCVMVPYSHTGRIFLSGSPCGMQGLWKVLDVFLEEWNKRQVLVPRRKEIHAYRGSSKSSQRILMTNSTAWISKVF